MMISQESDIAKQVIEEHEELKRNIGELRLTIMEKVSTKDFPDWRIQFIGGLADLKRKLTSHFEFEEHGGFMTEVIDEAPQLLNQVNELEIEHKQILADLDVVVKDFKKLSIKDDLTLQNILNRVSRIMNELHHHEMTENELMQSAFYREHGCPD